MEIHDKMYKTVHWATFRTMVTKIFNAENEENINNYDLTQVICYKIFGLQLQGKNVVFKTKNGSSCFVGDNDFDVFEIPNKANVRQLKGSY